MTSTAGCAATARSAAAIVDGGMRPLHPRLGHEQLRRREPAGDRCDHVALGRCVVAGDEADPAWKPRQRALSLGREEPFGRELLLEPLERGEVGAEAEALDREHLEAQLALLRPHLGAAVDVDSLAVRQVEAERVEPPSRKGCFHARAAVLVLEREEHGLPALLTPQLGDLALDPHGWQPPEPVGEARG